MMSPFFGSRVVLLILMAICASACDEAPAAPTPQPAMLSQFALTPATVDAGATSQASVSLTAPAANGVTVRLSSSDGVAVVPASIVVPAGAISVTFSVATRLVAADTSATISALLGADRRDAVLRVMAPIARPPTLQALEIEPSVLRGGQNAQGTIRLTGAALAPMAVTLRSSNTLATAPLTVTVLTGASSATFTVTTRPVTLDTVFDITGSLVDQSRSVQIRLTP
jgi:hypothetical protein